MLCRMEQRQNPTHLTETLFLEVRRALLLTGDAQPLSKRELAIIAAVAKFMVRAGADAPTQHTPEPEDAKQEPELLTPMENLPQGDWEKVNLSNGTNGSREYTGPRMKWDDGGFKSKPNDPPKKWERGRPVTYISPKTGERLVGRFMRINLQDKKRGNIQSSEQKNVFSVPLSAIEPTDLSPPSPIPLAVQI